MANDRLAVKFTVTVDGRTYVSAPPPGDTGVVSLEIEHNVNEASRLGLVVYDYVEEGDKLFREFNSIPNPRCNPNIPVQCWGGWEDGEVVKMFAGLLTVKGASYQSSQTEFTALHEAKKLRTKAKVKTFKNHTVLELLQKLAKEEGLVLRVDASAAGDEALTTPTSVIFQAGEPNWSLMLHYIHNLGYVTNTVRQNEIILKSTNASGAVVLIERGGGELKQLKIRQEHKRDKKAGRLKAHAHEPKPGKFLHNIQGRDCGGSRNVTTLPPAIAKKRREKRAPFTRFSVKGMARRLEREGDELSILIRLRPEMNNTEVVRIVGFGGQIDGDWDTTSVVHRLERGETQCTLVRP